MNTEQFLEVENTKTGDQDADNLVSIQEAFAMDDVTTDFLEAKEAELEDAIGARLARGKNAIPGWGDWGGPDTAKPLSRRALRRKRTKDRLEREEAAAKVAKKRRDGHLSHVVINDEAVEAQLQGFRPQSVPFPFRNAEEYERSLRMPLGKDFNTTKPRRA